jgi:AraC-like DNA-binding protein
MSKLQSCAPDSQGVRKLVEYRTAFYGRFSEFSRYETNQPARVGFRFGNPIICRMSAGKKHMKLPHVPTFTFLPGETMMIPSNMPMDIEFPEADIDNPTECICIEIESEKIDKIVEKMNENRDMTHCFGEWKFNPYRHSRFKNDPHVDYQIDKITDIFQYEEKPYRDALIDLNIIELVLRILQSNSRDLLIEETDTCDLHSGLAAAVQFIKQNPCEKIPIDQLSSLACMSQATLYRSFKLGFGVSPMRFITQVKMKKACEMLKEPDRSVTDICFELGYSNVGHFIKRFRLQIGETPKKYQQNAMQSASKL